MSEYLRPHLRAMSGYTPGEQPRDPIYLKLNTNESPYPPSPRVFEAVQAALTGERLRKYPDPLGTAFRQTAGRVLDLDPDSILIGATPRGNLSVVLDGRLAGVYGGITEIAVNAGAGNDTVLLGPRVITPAIIHGGPGNDTLRGGAGPWSLALQARQIIASLARGCRHARLPRLLQRRELLRDEQGQRLAKRHDALSLRNLRQQGKHPQELLPAFHTSG